MYKNFLILFILFFAVFLTTCKNGTQEKQGLKIKKGILDLSNWNIEKNGPVDLKGDWEFYWDKLLFTEDFKAGKIPEMNSYFSMPGLWNNYLVNGKKLSSYGYATFRLIIISNEKNTDMSLIIMSIMTSYTVYINGEKKGEAGIVGKNRENSKPQYLPQIVYFNTKDTNKTEIIIHISNFHNVDGGMLKSIKLGTSKQIRNIWENDISFSFFLFGALLIIGLYHLGLFIIRREEKSPLFFGVFCYIISMRIMVTGQTLILHFFPDINWQLLIKLEYFSLFTSVPVFLLFIYSIFPTQFSKTILYSNIFFNTAFCLITIFTPATISSRLLLPCHLILILTGIYVIYFFIKSVVKKIEFSLIFFIGFLILFTSAVNDILFSNGLIHSIYTIPIALFFFIIFESFVLSLRFSKAFLTVEKQKEELYNTNIAYKKEIIKREKLTQDLVEFNRSNLNSRLALIMSLAKLAEFRDKETGYHLERIREYSRCLALELKLNPKFKDYITEEYIDDLYYSSILHDIGKVGVPDTILLKPGKLTTKEFEIIKTHTIIGGDAINAIESKMNNRTYLVLGREIAYYHHEKWDGTGYPKGLKGEEIPLSARIVALADVYDALISKRIYKKPYTHEQVVKIINKSKGKQFDPDIIVAFNNINSQFYDIKNHFN